MPSISCHSNASVTIDSEENFYVDAVSTRMNSMPELDQAYILKMVEVYFEHNIEKIVARNKAKDAIWEKSELVALTT